MSNAVNPDQEEDKQDLDKIIKEFKEWLMIISVPKVATHSSAQGEQQQKLGDEVNVKLLRPNFYIFFEAFENTLLMEKNIINIRPI
jgi:predicted DNA binding CopG/RHH family protein